MIRLEFGLTLWKSKMEMLKVMAEPILVVGVAIILFWKTIELSGK